MSLLDPMPVTPLDGPIEATVTVPGSKSITNRALVCAALADGDSVLHHALDADDVAAMRDGLSALGVAVEEAGPRDEVGDLTLRVRGCAGRPTADVAVVDARLSGTTSRFLLPVAALTTGVVRVDGGLPLRARPMGPSIEALRQLGVTVTEAGSPGHLPVDVSDGPVAGGELEVPGSSSSQFLSGLLMAGPAMRTGLVVRVVGPLVSRPYVDMTVAVMERFGVSVGRPDGDTWVVEPQTYAASELTIEPDASTASYAFAAAAIAGGRVTVEGLGTGSLQGDVAFVDVLESMGATVERHAERITVAVDRPLRGVHVDMRHLSDTAQTLAVVAAFAEGPTRVTGIGFIRGKETDRVAAVVTELRRLGIDAEEELDGFLVRPGPLRPAVVETYDDHRMAMAFALAGLRAPGIRIADPGCVAKTFPGFWAFLERLRAGGGATGRVERS
ncbi:MAG TPA: 3-phosphoshikimate 1-carboxyvinyltransferase [Acidimicrobiales bacterium]|nr:3-phosphoshikimate 1-carboxyvinyltransferase [Acidimicrobiales bacterium]